MTSFREIQEEQKPWVAKNFPERRPTNPCLGIVEEFGEIFQAKTRVEYEDALGDIMIFAADLCSSLDLDLQELWENRIFDPAWKTNECIIVYLGLLCHSVLKHEQKIRLKENHLDGVAAALKVLFGILDMRIKYQGPDLDLLQVTEETWNVVKKRDWTQKDANY